MRPNRKEPVSALFWFQSLKFARMAASLPNREQGSLLQLSGSLVFFRNVVNNPDFLQCDQAATICTIHQF